MKYSPIDDLNDENARRAFGPPILYFLLPMVAIVLGLLVYLNMPAIDAFAERHPAIVGVSLLVLGVGGWTTFGRRNGLW